MSTSTDQPIISLTYAQIERAVKSATNALWAELLAEAPQTRRRPSTTRERITAVLNQAPGMAQDHPTLARFLSVRAMPKTMLRSKVGNATKDFESVIQAMLDDKTLLTAPAISNKGRAIKVYGLA